MSGEDEDIKLEKSSLERAEELSGKLQSQNLDDKLMHSVMENDKQTIEDGKLLNQAINNSMGSFTPDMMFDKMVENFSLAKNIYGERLLRALSGYDEEYIEKNIGIPEFQRELKKKISDKIEQLKKKRLLDKHNKITDQAIELAAIVSYVEELDRLEAKGYGEKVNKRESVYGDKGDVRAYRRGDRYRDMSVRKSLKTAVRRRRTEMKRDDLRIYNRQSKGKIFIIYAMDSSGSMKGEKIDRCKKAGIALAYKAIEEKDEVGLIVFGKEIERAVPPTRDFNHLLREMVSVRAFQETDISKTISKAIELFPETESTRHLILITDAMPTVGKEPEKETLDAASKAASAGITISLVGVKLDKKGEVLAEQIVAIGSGKLYSLKDTEDIDTVILEDYYERA